MSKISDRNRLRALLRNDLSSFIQRSFRTIDAGAAYLHNWHIDAIAHHLELVRTGRIRRLIITMPPRSLKSISASAAFPAFMLGKDPRRKIVAVSYGDPLAEKLARDCMKLMETDWYRDAFPMTRLKHGRKGRMDFETTLGGGRFSTTVNGVLTGRGGDIMIIDDPHKPEDAASEAKRTAVIDWFRSTALSRLDDPRNSPIILIQQRVHEADLAGTLLEEGGWTHLDLQAVAEDPVDIDLGARGIMRRPTGHLLHPERWPSEVLDKLKQNLGSYVFAAQYQQRPAPLGGGLIRWEWFERYGIRPMSQPGDRIVQSWDTASKATEANDWTVCSTWLVRGDKVWLLDLKRVRLEFPKVRDLIRSHAKRWKAQRILIEDAGSGTALIQDLKSSTGLSIIGVRPKDDKATRVLTISHLIEGGCVLIPNEAPWLADLQREIVLFPNGKHDDQVDSISQFLNWFGAKAAEPRIRVL